MSVTKIYLTRHGQTVWNTERRMQGHQDSPLTDLGILQASWLGDSLREIEFDAIYTSSSNRAFRTAEIIHRRNYKETPLFVKDSFREIHMGEWEGRLTHELEELYPAEYYAFWNTPHLFMPNCGESFTDVRQRVLPEVEEIAVKHQGRNVLIVTHTVTLKTIMAHFENRPLANLWHLPHIHPTSLSIVETEECPKIQLHGDISHYQAN